MNRCPTPSRLLPAPPGRRPAFPVLLSGACLALATALLAGPATVRAQTAELQSVRPFPATALRGTLVVVAPPEIRIDGKVERLSPGSRIRGPQNMLVMSGAIIGQTLLVNYTRESQGLIHEVWILTEAEALEKRPVANPPRNFIFGSEVDNTVKDDGKTPYNQLPGYGTRAN